MPESVRSCGSQEHGGYGGDILQYSILLDCSLWQESPLLWYIERMIYK